jgi:serine/threonine-protein kinase RsbW
MEQYFKRDIVVLEEVFGFIQHFVQRNLIPSSIEFTIKFVIEELFTNMVKYNSGGTTEILIRLEKKDKQCFITLIDHSLTSFDIRSTPEVDITRSAEDRTPGGLGIHLVKKMVDHIEYEFVQPESKITLIINLE